MWKFLTALLSAIGGFFAWKSSASKQYSDAKKSVEADMKKREDERQGVKDAVYNGDENAINSILNPAVAIIMSFTVLIGGCALIKPEVKVVRVTEDRYVSCVTNEAGEVEYWKVPPAIMVELVDATLELRQLKKDNKINERNGK